MAGLLSLVSRSKSPLIEEKRVWIASSMTRMDWTVGSSRQLRKYQGWSVSKRLSWRTIAGRHSGLKVTSASKNSSLLGRTLYEKRDFPFAQNIFWKSAKRSSLHARYQCSKKIVLLMTEIKKNQAKNSHNTITENLQSIAPIFFFVVCVKFRQQTSCK